MMVPRLMTMKVDQDDSCNKENDPLMDAFESCATFNNERGDDYQEQIGMPDEENMRQWSHHHTTDTVDDPVFRAAMRGSDSVSFVFGLEVTWSLIQQRQQEEEDKKALEAIQEAGEEEFVCTAAEQERSDDKEIVVSTELNALKDEVPGEVDEESDDDSSNDDTDGHDKSAQGEDSCSTVTALKPEGAIASLRSDVKTVDLEVMHSSQLDSPVAEALVASQSLSETSSTSSQTCHSREGWECCTCTLFNKRGVRKCEACGTKRPKVGTKRSLEEAL